MVNEIANIAIFIVMLILLEIVFLHNKKVMMTTISLFLIFVNVTKIFMGVSVCRSLFVIGICILNMGIVYYSNE